MAQTLVVELDMLSISITHHTDHSKYIFKGHLSESFDQRHIPQSQHRTVSFDLAGIEYVSSVGIREWVMLLNHWSKDHRVYFERCSIYFVDQMNMVPDCLGTATVKSVYAPYYRECDQCSGEKNQLIKFSGRQKSQQKMAIPEFQCERCDKPLEFDALDDSYFSFLNHS